MFFDKIESGDKIDSLFLEYLLFVITKIPQKELISYFSNNFVHIFDHIKNGSAESKLVYVQIIDFLLEKLNFAEDKFLICLFESTFYVVEAFAKNPQNLQNRILAEEMIYLQLKILDGEPKKAIFCDGNWNLMVSKMLSSAEKLHNCKTTTILEHLAISLVLQISTKMAEKTEKISEEILKMTVVEKFYSSNDLSSLIRFFVSASKYFDDDKIDFSAISKSISNCIFDSKSTNSSNEKIDLSLKNLKNVSKSRRQLLLKSVFSKFAKKTNLSKTFYDSEKFDLFVTALSHDLQKENIFEICFLLKDILKYNEPIEEMANFVKFGDLEKLLSVDFVYSNDKFVSENSVKTLFNLLFFVSEKTEKQNLLAKIMAKIMAEIDKQNLLAKSITRKEYLIYCDQNENSKKVSIQNSHRLVKEKLDKNALAKKYSNFSVQDDFDLICLEEEKERQKWLNEKTKEILLEEQDIREKVNQIFFPFERLLTILRNFLVFYKRKEFETKIKEILIKLVEISKTDLVYFEVFQTIYSFLEKIPLTFSVAEEMTRTFLSENFDLSKTNKIFAHFSKNILRINSENVYSVFVLAPIIEKYLKLCDATSKNFIQSNKIVKNLLFCIFDRLFDDVDNKFLIWTQISPLEELLKAFFCFIFSKMATKADPKTFSKTLLKTTSLFSKNTEISLTILNLFIKFDKICSNLISSNSLKFKSRLYILLNHQNEKIKNKDQLIWNRHNFKVDESMLQTLFKLSTEHRYDTICKLASTALSELTEKIDLFEKLLRMITIKMAKNDKISQKKNLIWLLAANSRNAKKSEFVKQIFDFFVASMETENLWEMALKSSLFAVKSLGFEFHSVIFPLLERYLKDKNNEQRNKGVIILVAALSEYVSNQDEYQMENILNSLIDSLSIPSEEVQIACSDHIFNIIAKHSIDSGKILVQNSTEKLLKFAKNANLDIAKGGARGIAIFAKSFGIEFLFSSKNIFNFLNKLLNSKNHCQSAILAFCYTFQIFGIQFEPFLLPIFDDIFRCCEEYDKNGKTLDNFFANFLSNVSHEGLDILISRLVDLSKSTKWKKRLVSLKILEKILKTRLRSISATNLKIIVTDLQQGLADANTAINESARNAIKTIFMQIKVPELVLKNMTFFKAFVKNDEDCVLESLQILSQTTFYYKLENYCVCLIIPILLKSLRLNNKEIKLLTLKILSCLTKFMREAKMIFIFKDEIVSSLKNCLFDISPLSRTISSLSLCKLANFFGADCLENVVEWSINVISSPKTNKIEILGIAGFLANAVAIYDEEKSKNFAQKYLKDGINSENEKKRECFYEFLGFLPETGANNFISVDLFSLVFRGFCDSVDEVRDASIKAGRSLLPGLIGFEEECASVIMKNLDDEDTKIRAGAVEMSALFLLSISGFTESLKLSTFDLLNSFDISKTQKVEDAILQTTKIENSTKLDILAVLYYSRYDVETVSKIANDVWKAIIFDRKKVLRSIVPFLTKNICQNLALISKQQTASKALGRLVSNSNEETALLFLSALSEKSLHEKESVRRGMLLGVTRLLQSASQDETLINIVPAITSMCRKSLEDNSKSVRAAGAAVFYSLLNENCGKAYAEEILSSFAKNFCSKNFETKNGNNYKIEKEALISLLQCEEVHKNEILIVAKSVLEKFFEIENFVFAKTKMSALVEIFNQIYFWEEDCDKEKTFVKIVRFLVDLAVSNRCEDDIFVIETMTEFAFEADKSDLVMERLFEAVTEKREKVVVIKMIKNYCEKQIVFEVEFSKVLANEVCPILFGKDDEMAEEMNDLLKISKMSDKNLKTEILKSICCYIDKSSIPKTFRKEINENILKLVISSISSKNKVLVIKSIEMSTKIIDDSTLQKHVLRLAGPLIRFANEDIPTDSKIAILNTTRLMTISCAKSIKAFIPQLQVSFIKLVEESGNKEIFKNCKMALIAFSETDDVKGLNKVKMARALLARMRGGQSEPAFLRLANVLKNVLRNGGFDRSLDFNVFDDFLKVVREDRYFTELQLKSLNAIFLLLLKGCKEDKHMDYLIKLCEEKIENSTKLNLISESLPIFTKMEQIDMLIEQIGKIEKISKNKISLANTYSKIIKQYLKINSVISQKISQKNLNLEIFKIIEKYCDLALLLRHENGESEHLKFLQKLQENFELEIIEETLSQFNG